MRISARIASFIAESPTLLLILMSSDTQPETPGEEPATNPPSPSPETSESAAAQSPPTETPAADPAPATHVEEETAHQHHGPLGLLMISALGVVYGDIGTSPLYAMRETFHHTLGLHPDQETVLGVLSLITWSLLIIICVKYLAFVMRADLHGEGGILTLTGLVGKSAADPGKRSIVVLTLLGLFGTALLYGEGVITPAISVLSAVEGLKVATPIFEPYILPITIVILVALFSIQSGGTEAVGKIFGPITLLWFLSLFGLGAYHITDSPVVFKAVNPFLGLGFLTEHGWKGFLVLGSVVLVVTGAEALYADMGHFGRRPIRWAWFVIVLPSLLVNYYGQAALILANPSTVDNPFFKMVPTPLLYPMVVLATAATVIASQALISGSYSMTMQAIRLGYLPRLKVVHTSKHAAGQIYVPAVNWALMVACIALVIGFKSSSALAAAYGLAVTGAMVTTTLLLYMVSQNLWRWPLPASLGMCSVFLAIDLTFFSANIIKIPAGGWFPLVVGCVLFTILTTWYRGRVILGQAMQPMSASSQVDKPYRVRVEDLGHGFYQVRLRFGYMERCDVPGALASVPELGIDPTNTTYFLGREVVIPTVGGGMALWREKLFASLSQNSLNATAFFHIPPDRVVEVGSQVCI